MATPQRIPLQSETTDQLVSVSLGDNPYILRVLWNERAGYFSLSVLTADSVVIVANIKMVKNYPLVSRLKDIRLPVGELYLIQENGNKARPDYTDLEVSCFLYYYEPDYIAPSLPTREQAASTLTGTLFDSGLTSWDTGSTLWDQ